MSRSPDHRRSSGGGGGAANLLLAVSFLLLLGAAAAAALYFLFRPRDPDITISGVRLPAFSAANGTASFTFAQFASVHNPNRAVFSHFDSTLQLVYAGNQVGFMFIPAGRIDAGRTQYMTASFAVNAVPLSPVGSSSPIVAATTTATMPADAIDSGSGGGDGGGGGGGAVLEVVSRLRMQGRVTVLKFFTHNVESTAQCRIAVAAGSGAVLGFRC